MNPVVELFRSYIGVETLDERLPVVVRWLKLQIVEANVGHIKLSARVRPDMCNPAQVLHGGLQCTMRTAMYDYGRGFWYGSRHTGRR